MDWKKFSPWNWLKDEPAASGAPDGGTAQLPTRSLSGLHQEIDRIFEQAFRGSGFPAPLFGRPLPGFFRPKLDISETADSYRITLEIPGIGKDQVQVMVEGDSLIVRGEKREESSKKEEHCQYTERSYGSFQRVLALPEDADRDNLKASFADGVLSLTIPRRKVAASKSRNIAID